MSDAAHESGRAGILPILERIPLRTLWLTVAAFLAVVALHVAALALFGHLSSLIGPTADPRVRASFRTASIIALLIAYTAATSVQRRSGLARDLHRLAPHLDGPAPAVGGIAASVPGWAIHAASWGGAAVGVAVVVLIEQEQSPEPWDFHLTWALLANGVLFALMGRRAVGDAAANRFLERRVTGRVRIDLLDLQPLGVFARRGLAAAMYWLIGSSIASLLFLSFGFSWVHLAILTATLTVGILVFLQPMRAIHRRIRAEKRRELERVRSALREARDGALAGDAEAAGRLPGILAYEARVTALGTWPFDVPSAIRLAALASLAIGSWVGGAVIERLLGWAVD